MTDLEDLLFYQLTAVLDPAHVTIEREYKFHPTRKWRAGLCYSRSQHPH